MTIHKENNLIYVIFENTLEEADTLEKFNIFIKNIFTDYRSKIDEQGLDTKLRLLQFFCQCRS